MRLDESTPDKKLYVVYDRETMKPIEHILWADDKTGEYEQYVLSSYGGYLLKKGKYVTQKRRGKLLIIKNLDLQ